MADFKAEGMARLYEFDEWAQCYEPHSAGVQEAVFARRQKIITAYNLDPELVAEPQITSDEGILQDMRAQGLSHLAEAFDRGRDIQNRGEA